MIHEPDIQGEPPAPETGQDAPSGQPAKSLDPPEAAELTPEQKTAARRLAASTNAQAAAKAETENARK